MLVRSRFRLSIDLTFAVVLAQNQTRMIIRIFFCTTVLASTALSQTTTLAIDDGTAESVLGFGSPTDVFALNSFPSGGVPLAVTSIQIAWGSPNIPGFYPNGTSIIAYVWNDPNGDGDPGDATVLQSVSGAVAAADTNTFITYVFPSPAVVTTLNFFVGFLATASELQLPAAGDFTSPIPHRSYLAQFDPGAGNPNNLGAANIGFFTDGPPYGEEASNFLIRADVVTVPEPGSSTLFLLGVVGFAVTVGRKFPGRC